MKRTNNITELLKGRREASGLTQGSLATMLGINAAYVSLIESGRRKPSLRLVARLADVLGLNRQEALLLARPGNERPSVAEGSGTAEAIAILATLHQQQRAPRSLPRE
jgi:transcriptional regulator with XRE-family HTH domain